MEREVTRSDAWDHEEDAVLADTVIEHIRTGSTQLQAFVEASTRLGRTPAACGYRWNGVVRKLKGEEVTKAKSERRVVMDARLYAPREKRETFKKTLEKLYSFNEVKAIEALQQAGNTGVVAAVKCKSCGTLHDSSERTFITLQGNLLVGLDGGIIGNGNWLEHGIPSTHWCVRCLGKEIGIILQQVIADPSHPLPRGEGF